LPYCTYEATQKIPDARKRNGNVWQLDAQHTKWRLSLSKLVPVPKESLSIHFPQQLDTVKNIETIDVLRRKMLRYTQMSNLQLQQH
jgi:hypothetical protein